MKTKSVIEDRPAQASGLSEKPRWRQDAEQNLKIAHKLKPWEPR